MSRELARGTMEATQIWKRFRVEQRRRLLRDRLSLVTDALRGRRRAWQWALRDVNVLAEPGEAIGLVGPNGSGKSTLLKILSRVMYPYAGRVEVSGRVGALIEVRAGIHPELSGRENVYLYGSLLGLPRKMVTERFDAIVEFAEVDHAIDRQVKYYSSGMQMRLGFAVAAFLEPDILLVDEVLAVGDASFQQRCLDRMRSVIQQGTTLVFVSHDLAAVEATATRGIWIQEGVVQSDGPVRDVLGSYRAAIEASAEQGIRIGAGGMIDLKKIEVAGVDGQAIKTQEPVEITVVVDSDADRPSRIHLGVSEGPATPIFVLQRDTHLTAGETEIRCLIPRLPLPRGRFYLWLGISNKRQKRDLIAWQPASHFDVAGPDLDPTPRAVVRLAPVHVESHWEIERH